ncbi:hypothetical protein KJ996_06105 [Patescibacteria group bacterium]|nr:hypothetical protein [Patescibacteria group bacterium]
MRRIFTAPNISTSKTRERRRSSQPSEEPKQCGECASSDSCPMIKESISFEEECRKKGLKPIYFAGTMTPDGKMITSGISTINEELN